mmetsp:Transcript_36131/g.49571  ORF Transcript_36131/g.49571 Transcript_36131/m.49571 type:complete len:84 (+) Transcript_36131:3-254(+)
MERTARFVSFDMTAVFTSPFLRNRVMKGRRKGEVDKKNPFEGFCEIGVDSRTKPEIKSSNRVGKIIKKIESMGLWVEGWTSSQ